MTRIQSERVAVEKQQPSCIRWRWYRNSYRCKFRFRHSFICQGTL